MYTNLSNSKIPINRIYGQQLALLPGFALSRKRILPRGFFLWLKIRVRTLGVGTYLHAFRASGHASPVCAILANSNLVYWRLLGLDQLVLLKCAEDNGLAWNVLYISSCALTSCPSPHCIPRSHMPL